MNAPKGDPSAAEIREAVAGFQDAGLSERMAVSLAAAERHWQGETSAIKSVLGLLIVGMCHDDRQLLEAFEETLSTMKETVTANLREEERSENDYFFAGLDSVLQPLLKIVRSNLSKLDSQETDD